MRVVHIEHAVHILIRCVHLKGIQVIIPELTKLFERPVHNLRLPEFLNPSPGGFEARIVRPNEALVLYLDSELVQRQLDEADEGASAEGSEPAALQAAGALGDVSMGEFRASWAFELVPEEDGSTRLVERMRFLSSSTGMLSDASLPLMGLGVFVMTRKHMLGIKERVERSTQ